jgi:hypothetical protein
MPITNNKEIQKLKSIYTETFKNLKCKIVITLDVKYKYKNSHLTTCTN